MTIAHQVLTAEETRRLEQGAFERGVSAESLMDLAGEGIAQLILDRETQAGLCVVYLGKGNNAGDALVVASILARSGWEIWIREAVPPEQLQPLPKKKLQSLSFQRIQGPIARLPRRRARIIIDGLLGVGARSRLKPELSALTREINQLRRNSDARVYAVDLPTGVGEDGIDVDAVVADLTATVGFPKTALLSDQATNFVGRIFVVELEQLTVRGPRGSDGAVLSGPANLREFNPRRQFDSHKGDYGRVGIVAGSRGFVGASILCSEAAARSGAGLISLYVPEEIYDLAVVKAAPEIMVKATADFRSVENEKLDAIGLGPGLGRQEELEILELITGFKGPMVVDADGLNCLSTRIELLERCAGPRLLTPHPGEMSRLWPEKGESRSQIVKAFCSNYPVALLLKGARTLVGQRGKPLAYNSTGSPGLATGGSGDVLTGVCAALLARGVSAYDSGRLGAWLCGRAAELALSHFSEESLLPSDLLKHFGTAFAELHRD